MFQKLHFGHGTVSSHPPRSRLLRCEPLEQRRLLAVDIPSAAVSAAVALEGTGNDDVLTIEPGDNPGEWRLTLNGNPPQVLSGPDVSVEFDGLGGDDTVNFTGTADSDSAVIFPDRAEFNGSGYSMTMVNIEATVYDGDGGQDTAVVWGSSAFNRYDAHPGHAEMTEGGVQIISVTAENIYARGGGGGDQAFLHDSDGDDLLEFFPIWARMSGDGYFNHIFGFKTMDAPGELGTNGVDRAVFRGSTANDWFQSTAAFSRLFSGTGAVWHFARGYEDVVAYGRGGKIIDEAFIQDTDGADSFDVRPLRTIVTTPLYSVDVRGFGTLQVNRVNQDSNGDVITLGDSKGDDTLVGNPEQVTISGPSFSNTVLNFPDVQVFSTTGDDPDVDNGEVDDHDTAFLSDFTNSSDLDNDTFTANANSGELAGSDYRIGVFRFDEVHAEATFGYDIAHLDGSRGADVLNASATEVSLSGQNIFGLPFDNHALSFNRIFATGFGGADSAVLSGATVEPTFEPPDGVLITNFPQALSLEQIESIAVDGQIISGIDEVFAYWGAPVIGGLLADPDPVVQGSDLTLTAIGVTDSDGTIEEVEFYWDADGDGLLDPATDLLLDVDTAAVNGWTWTGSTSIFPAGINTFLARALDDDLIWSQAAVTTAEVVSTTNPSINSLSDSPDPVVVPNDVTLTANGVSDPDGTVAMVEFYRDADGDGALDVDTDELLGTDTTGSDGWTLAVSSANLPTGVNRYFAIAVDDDDFLSMW